MSHEDEMERLFEGILQQLHMQNAILANLCWEMNTVGAILMAGEGESPLTDDPSDTWEKIEWHLDQYEYDVIPNRES